jgi:hypothetical protein
VHTLRRDKTKMSTDEPDDEARPAPRKREFLVRLLRGVDNARQWAQPAPFRIEEPPEDGEAPRTRVAGNAFRNSPLGATNSAGGDLADSSADISADQSRQTLAAVATALWRVRAKLEAVGDVELPSELRHLPRHIQSAWDALAAGGIEVRDPTGERYVPGAAFNPLTFQPVPGLDTEIVFETIKPAVLFKNNLIQWADVIVGVPPEPGSDRSEHDPDANSNAAEAWQPPQPS